VSFLLATNVLSEPRKRTLDAGVAPWFDSARLLRPHRSGHRRDSRGMEPAQRPRSGSGRRRPAGRDRHGARLDARHPQHPATSPIPERGWTTRSPARGDEVRDVEPGVRWQHHVLCLASCAAWLLTLRSGCATVAKPTTSISVASSGVTAPQADRWQWPRTRSCLG